jgi:peptidoglycan hydrolase CwlO-like protein
VGSIVEGLKTLNSAFRTVLLASLVGVMGLASYFGYSEYTKRERLLQDKDDQIEFAQKQLVSMQSELDGKVAKIGQLNQELEQQAIQI